MQRLVCLRWTPGDVAAARTAQAMRQRLDGAWQELTNRRGVLMLWRDCAVDAHHIVLTRDCGLVMGPLFRRDEGGHRRVTTIGDDELERWRTSSCESFAEAYWGNYLLVFHDRGGDVLHVLRDPTGSRACFEAEADGVAILVTHAQDFLRLSPEAAPDDGYLSAFIAHSRMVSRRTAIAGLHEILPGEQISFARQGGVARMFWRPPPYLDCRESFETAAERLRQTAGAAAGAWTQMGAPILHQLSGGLDSSAALGCLRQAAPQADILCLNEYPLHFKEGDERAFARISADHAHAPLRGLAFDPAAIDYAKLATPDLAAKPSIAHLSFATPLGAFDGEGAALMTTGKGGDQLFQRSAPPAVAVEAARCGLSLQACLDAALDAAIYNKISVWGVLGAQVLNGVLRFKAPAPLPVTPLAAGEGRATALQALAEHPWLNGAKPISPLQALRLRGLMDLSYYHADNVWSERFACAHVLTAQPIVEACFATPPWLMIAGGKDRALERAAFAPMLDARTLARSNKGDSTRFFTAAMERAIPFMREILIEGELWRRGVVDCAALSAALTRDVIPVQAVKANLMACLVAELWVRRFLVERATAQAKAAGSDPSGGAVRESP